MLGIREHASGCLILHWYQGLVNGTICTKFPVEIKSFGESQGDKVRTQISEHRRLALGPYLLRTKYHRGLGLQLMFYLNAVKNLFKGQLLGVGR